MNNLILLKTCSLFGHRYLWCDVFTLREELRRCVENLIKRGLNRFLVGNHGEFDRLALSVCVELKKVYKHIEICVVVTSLNGFIKNDVGAYDYVGYSRLETMSYEVGHLYPKRRIIASNQMMIDDSDLVVCYVKDNVVRSGADRAMKYAIKNNKKVINLFKKDANCT